MKDELVIYTKPKGATSEAIRTLRTNLQFSLIDETKKVIMVTSSIPGEGKSFISANLAGAFSMVNKKVLLIDCDLRKGRQATIFNVQDDKGLSMLLLEDVRNYKRYIRQTDVEKLDLLLNGMVPPNPSELLGSTKMQELMEELRNTYDIIILDCPPVSAVTDAVVLSNLADKIVIVSSYKKTPYELLSSTCKAFDAVKEKLAGVVINQVKRKKGSKYYSDRYYQ
jgi:capsular exopolysaccharide synthesis family protein